MAASCKVRFTSVKDYCVFYSNRWDCVICRYLVKTRKEQSGGLSVKYLIGEEKGPKTVDTTLEGIVKLYRRAAVGYDCSMGV